MQYIITALTVFIACIAAEYAWRWHARREWQKREQKAKVEAEQIRVIIEARAREALRAAELEWRRKAAN